MNGRFKPGDHLHVLRLPYFHHGIYVSNDRVIQFGSGVTLKNKGSVGITDVPLKDFEQGGTATVVRHGYESPFTGYHPAADEGWKVVARAEFLLKLQPRLPYNLIGHNCEVIANMCASGSWTESYQVRRIFGGRAAMDIAFLLWRSARLRANKPIPRWVQLLAVAGVIATLAAKFTYDDQIRRFWNEIRVDWQAHELQLARDPRNN